MDAGQTTSYIDDDGKKKTGVVAPNYNRDTDYAQYMQRAAAEGDMGAASYYENQRNKKIAGEGMDYSPSNLYAQYAKEYTQEEMNRLEGGYTPSYNAGTDYAALSEKAAQSGDYAAAAYYEQQRNKKIAGEGLTQYQPEYTYQKYATDYDDAQKAALERGYQTAAEKAQATGYLESALNALQSGGAQNTEYDDALKALQEQRWQGTEYDDVLAALQEQLQQQLAANETESAKQTELSMLKIQQQKEEAEKKYDSADRQLYIDMMKTQKALPEQLASAGYTGGASESSLLKNRLTYEQALRENESGRADAVNALNIAGNEAALQQEIAKIQADQQARSDYMSSYSNAKLTRAQAQQQADSSYMSNYLSLLEARAQAQQQERSNYLSNYLNLMSSMQSQKNYDQEQSLSRQQQQTSYAQAAADTMAKYGDFTGYANVTDGNGNRLYSDEQITAMKAEYDALKAASSAASSGSGGGYSYSNYSYTPAETEEENEEEQEWTSADFVAKLAEAKEAGWTNKQIREQIDQAYEDELISQESRARLKYQYRD